jgi:hypothetical protein
LLYGLHRLDFPSAVAENQPANKNRMTTELSNFAARLRESIQGRDAALRRPVGAARRPCQNLEFDTLALELFAIQFQHNAAYRKICAARGFTPGIVEHWTRIPAVPTSAFKELELTCLAPNERTAVFHSSGTTEQKPSRHFHSPESLKLYEVSLIPWFLKNVVPDLRFTNDDLRLVCLAPPPPQAPHSSLVHMFETVRQKLGGASVPALSSRQSRWGGEGGSRAEFLGSIAADGSWTLDGAAVVDALSPRRQPASPKREREGGTPAGLAEARARRQDARPLLLLGTAFSFVHLLDFLAERNLRFDLPAGSRVMETGGYKNRSRSMPKTELHQFITERLGIPSSHIICEYGMSELSSQAYDGIEAGARPSPGAATLNMRASSDFQESPGASPLRRPGRAHSGSNIFHFPPWARVQIISPETGFEMSDGETGLIRVFDLANVFSVMAIQTEDLAIRHGGGFELLGRATQAEPRGCSLMAQSAFYNPQSAIK